MENIIETIRTALATSASTEQRAAGVTACHEALAALGAAPGQPTPAMPPIATMVAALRNVPRDQLLDLVIARLRASIPAGTEVTRPEIRFRLPAPLPKPDGSP